MKMQRRTLLAVASAMAIMTSMPAMAQDFPNGPVTFRGAQAAAPMPQPG